MSYDKHVLVAPPIKKTCLDMKISSPPRGRKFPDKGVPKTVGKIRQMIPTASTIRNKCMGRAPEIFLCLLLILSFFHTSLAQGNDAASFRALVSDWKNRPSSWVGTDPCAGWVGINCTSGPITAIQLSSMGLEGSLTGDVGGLVELQTLDLSYNPKMGGTLPNKIGSLTKLRNLILIGCNFYGQIPDLSGLQELVFLSLNLNKFSGSIPPSIGSLKKLYWLDLADNMLTGEIPISDGRTPGLDQLTDTQHFHFGNNKIVGKIPPKLLSSEMKLIHLLFDNNSLEGTIPSTLGLAKNLEVVRLDRNSLNGPIPDNINNLTNLGELYLSNNELTGPLPDLTGMSQLHYLDLSNNTFDATTAPAWFSSLSALTTLIMERLMIGGEVPADMFSIPQLQTVRLRNNHFNGTLNISNSHSNQLNLVDLRSNRIEYLVDGGSYEGNLMLQQNPYCQQAKEHKSCKDNLIEPTTTYSTPRNCPGKECSSGEEVSPKCQCAYPYSGTLFFRAPSFSNIDHSHYQDLEVELRDAIKKLILVDVYLYGIVALPDEYLQIGLKVFPSNARHFNQSEIPIIGFILSNQTFKPPPGFGPFYFVGSAYQHFPDEASGSESNNIAAIIGAIAGGILLVAIIIILAICVIKRKRIPNAATKDQPQLKGARYFSFDEMRHCTNNFSEGNDIGSGGYGMVYRGVLENGQLVAIKRAKERSVQGVNEFNTEIELLSRVHHKNLVTLVGFCFDKGEQMLVYEYIPNGSLRDSLSGKSGVRLDWRRRLRVALGSARGLAYLHELAHPPIVHRDVKSGNILLDHNLVAKVADFGLCKSLGYDDQKTHVTTQVKGTMGYLDPEYYMTQRLTEKSDVYSFGVLMLELVTGRQPIERGRYVVREVHTKKAESEELYGLHEFVDPALLSDPDLPGFEKLIDLALRCVEEEGERRPTMSDVVKDLEGIMQSAGVHPNMDSTRTSSNYGEVSSSYDVPLYSNEGIATYNSGVPYGR